MTVAYKAPTIPFEKITPITWPASEVALVHRRDEMYAGTRPSVAICRLLQNMITVTSLECACIGIQPELLSRDCPILSIDGHE